MPICRPVCLSLLVLNLLGCSLFQDEPLGPAVLRAAGTSAPGAPGSVWLGPSRQASRHRTLFFGHDTVSYRLAAWESGDPGKPVVYRLLVDASYGGAKPRHYDLARLADGSTRATLGRKHATERCQLFNSLVSACLFRDLAWLEFSRAELDAAGTEGLALTLASEAETYERVELTAADVRSLLDAVGPAR